MIEKTGRASVLSIYADLFRHRDGVFPNTVAIGYALAGYVLALFLLAGHGIGFLLGIVLLAHSLVIAAYLIHECSHGSLFREQRHHAWLARILSWLTGACYGDVDRIRDKHLRHHFERADIVAVDYRRFLTRRPVLRRAVLLGQYCGLPAVELLMHGLVVIRPFLGQGTEHDRRRVLGVMLVRALFFAALAAFGGWMLLLGYAAAYLVFLSVLGFMDSFQHRYLLLTGLDAGRAESPTRDTGRFPTGYFSRQYEDQHTYSNLLSARWPRLNLLVLNFAYHNVHHQKPMEPWYRLPSLHRDAIAGGEPVQELPIGQQVRDYWRYRVARVMAPATDSLDSSANIGVAGVSFLTPL